MAFGRAIAVIVLLDTHVLFWWLVDSPRLAASHRAILSSTEDPVLVSAVTGWEIAIKVKLGKWPDAAPLLPRLEETIREQDFVPALLTMGQAILAGSLDLAHRDPFDRMLAAQSMALDAPILTSDPALKLLGCKVIE